MRKADAIAAAAAAVVAAADAGTGAIGPSNPNSYDNPSGAMEIIASALRRAAA